MWILDYVSKNYILLMELTGLWIISCISVHVSKHAVKFTRIAAILLLLDSLFYNVESWTQTFDSYTVWRPILTASVYTVQPLIMISIMQIAAPLKQKRLWLILPAAAGAVLYFTSQWTGLVCWFSEANGYHGGPLSLLPYIIFAFYTVLFIIQCVKHLKNYPVNDKLTVLYIIFTPLIGVAIYYLTETTGDYSAIFASAILLYYLFWYIHMAKIDPLTGLMNRQCFYNDIRSIGQKFSAAESVDMNGLKQLNDSKGHTAGDTALKAIAKVLLLNSGNQKKVYRIGGDEFVIIYSGTDCDAVINDIETMRSEMSKTPYSCAFGYAFHDKSGEDIGVVLKASDKLMYEDKARTKKTLGETGDTPAGISAYRTEKPN
ncbi:MAG: GGDEF domain-containing protein [Clostridia bacterium]|nr:GGDEF domain-containing protein [Clostridia bacterium]